VGCENATCLEGPLSLCLAVVFSYACFWRRRRDVRKPSATSKAAANQSDGEVTGVRCGQLDWTCTYIAPLSCRLELDIDIVGCEEDELKFKGERKCIVPVHEST